MLPNQPKVQQQLSPKNTSTKYQHFSDMKRYLDNIPKRQNNHPSSPSSNLIASGDSSQKINPISTSNNNSTLTTNLPPKSYSIRHNQQLSQESTHPSTSASATRQNNPYLSPVSLGRLKQLQLGKRFLRDMKNGLQSQSKQQHIKPVSPDSNNSKIIKNYISFGSNNNLATGGSSALIPKYKSYFDASHGVNSYQIPNNQKFSHQQQQTLQKYNNHNHNHNHNHNQGSQVRSSSTKHKKILSGNNPMLNNYQYRQHQNQQQQQQYSASSREAVTSYQFNQQKQPQKNHQSNHNHNYSYPQELLKANAKRIFTTQNRISQNNEHYTLSLQPWSIYFTPGQPGQKVGYNLPPDRKIPPNQKIEKQLKDFKREIDQKFTKTPLKAYKFPRDLDNTERDEEGDRNSDLESEFSEFGDEMAYHQIEQQEKQEARKSYHQISSKEGRYAPQPNSIHIQNQQHTARQGLSTSSAHRGVMKQSPLRGISGFNQQMFQTQQYEQCKSYTSNSRGGDIYQKGNSNKVKKQLNFSKPLNPQFNSNGERVFMREVLGSQIYENYRSNNGVVALVSPTAKIKKGGNIVQNAPKHDAKPLSILKDISFERKAPSKRKKLKINGLSSTDFQIISRNSSNLSPNYMNSLHSTQNAWEQSQQVTSPKAIVIQQGGGGGTGAPLTPPPAAPYAFSPDQEITSPNQRDTHRSFVFSEEVANAQLKNQTKYLTRDNKNAKSQSHKQATSAYQQNQIFKVKNQIAPGKEKKSQPLQPLELLSSEQISPPQSIPLQNTNAISGFSQSKPPSGGTGSITYHQSEAVVSPKSNSNNINSSSYRSLRQNKQHLQLNIHNNTTRSSSKPKHPLIDINSPSNMSNRQKQQLFASSTHNSSYTHPKVLPPEALSSIYLKQTPQYQHYQATGKNSYTTTNNSRVISNNSSQQPSSRGNYHGNWSILGTVNNHNLSTNKSNNNANEKISSDIYMGNQILQPSNSSKFKRNYRGPSGAVSHQRAKTSHIESSQSQLAASTASHQTSHNDSHQLLNNQHNSSQKLSALKLQQQQQLNHSGSSGRKAKNSSSSQSGKKKQSIKNYSNVGYAKQTPNQFDLNISFDNQGLSSGVQTTTASKGRTMHSTTLSREINMINQQIQNADQTMKLLIDDDLRMGFFKPGTTKGQQQVEMMLNSLYRRPNLRNIAV